ncbi:MAG TPA: thioredoxin fold domain-containing protein [Fimbriimonadaceae bacterium]|nr:thioredoxin fold domain-containing protein [Fimbriimonadaceae bacterium]
MEQVVYSTDDFKQAAKKWVLCKINGEKGEGPALMQQYGVSGFPTIKFMKADGTVFGEIGGYEDPPKFIADMNAALGAAR